MPTFVMINEKQVINLDLIEEIKRGEEGEGKIYVLLVMFDGTRIFIRDEEQAKIFWNGITHMPDQTHSQAHWWRPE